MCYTRVALDSTTLCKRSHFHVLPRRCGERVCCMRRLSITQPPPGVRPRSPGLAVIDDFLLLWLIRMVTELSIARPTAGTNYETLVDKTRRCAIRFRETRWSISMAIRAGRGAYLFTSDVFHPASDWRSLLFSYRREPVSSPSGHPGRETVSSSKHWF